MRNFAWKGKTYLFDANACYKGNGLIKLPSGEILRVSAGWLETLPPIPLGIKVCDYLPGLEPEGAVLATLVEEEDEQ